MNDCRYLLLSWKHGFLGETDDADEIIRMMADRVYVGDTVYILDRDRETFVEFYREGLET